MPATIPPTPPFRLEGNGRPAGFTLVELLVTIVIIAVLATVTSVVARQLITRSQTMACANNLRVIGLASLAYSQDHQSNLPASSHQRRSGRKSWSVDLQAYAGDSLPLRCAQDTDPQRPYSYVINDNLLPLSVGSPLPDFSKTHRIPEPSATVLFIEAVDGHTGGDHAHFSNFRGAPIPWDSFRREVAMDRHGSSANFLFVDGHVETLNAESAKARLTKPGSQFIEPAIRP